jgi:NAD-dependent SIR2 family protein deacetylase
MTTTPDYSARLDAAARALAEADAVLIGAGAGLSAAAGLNYQSPELFSAWYPQFAALGYTTIWDAITHHWYPSDANRREFWAFWATHIQRIRYAAPPGQPYRDLLQLAQGKPYFVITTNADGQFEKAGFERERLFTPQGDYGQFQCATPCRNILYDNRERVQQMLAHLDETGLRIPAADIPLCPQCGGYLERNLRIDARFVEEPHMARQGAYADFINQSADRKLVLLELGVGFNTPAIIRWPFERITARHPQATLMRINRDDAQAPKEIAKKALGFEEDAARVLHDLLTARRA